MIAAALDELLANERYRTTARAFAAKHAAYDSEAAQEEILSRIEGILNKKASVASTQ